MNKIRMGGALTKVEARPDGSVYVAGIASAEVVDHAGETVTADAMRKAIPAFMEAGAGPLREMHQLIAAGKVIGMEVRGRDTHAECLVVDEAAIKKVKAGVYRAFSIGGVVTSRDPEDPNVITGLRLAELSLVDSPMNPAAVIEVVKLRDPAKEMTKGIGRGRRCDVCGDRADVVLCGAHTVRPSKKKADEPTTGDVIAKLQGERDDLGARLAKAEGDLGTVAKAFTRVRDEFEAARSSVEHFRRERRDLAKAAAAVEARAEAAERERDELRAAFAKAQRKGALREVPDAIFVVEKAGDVSGLTKAEPKPTEPATALDAIREAQRRPVR